MYNYPINELKQLLSGVLQQQLNPAVLNWLEEVSSKMSPVQFNMAFAMMPRKTGKPLISITQDQLQAIESVRPGFNIEGWSIDRLARVWLLLHLDSSDRERYIHTIENYFRSAELHELVALYSALPVLAYPEAWVHRCAEGIRCNIGDVLLAIICRNPYPSEYLSEASWNQLVLKAIFTDKPVEQITGLDSRANRDLAIMLSDYAHERWAAGRPVNPQLWTCVGRFIDEKNFPDIERLAFSENLLDREAACLACWQSSFPAAKELLNQHAEIYAAIESGDLTWNTLAEKSHLPVS